MARGSRWPIQDAKNRLSEVIETARREGPQFVTRHGEERAVVISIEDFRALTTGPGDLVEFLRRSPLMTAGLKLDRARDMGRAIDL